ncbi:16S rRNA (guanine(527)-N(7))-methyltransferase RsmG [Xanthobacter autotrophicus]|uniref:16S rRNA (guanine(527)-N(7))-methyltransferase RsmG n=1 Tax=Xanthobacter autotrophicus TaxID=280 RepID=UPI0037265750
MKGGKRESGSAGREAIAAVVSRETLGRLTIIADLLVKWQKTINLVAPATLPDLWARHVGDSLQLVHHVPQTPLRWVDLGSGGGFPGLVVAAVLAERDGAHMHLVESDTRKAAFLREAARLAQLPVSVHAARIEQVAQALAPGTHVVSARALAPLPKLLDLAAPFLAAGAIGLFPKGRDAERELTEAARSWTLDCDLRPSTSDPEARILLVRGARRGTDTIKPQSGARSLGEPEAGGGPPECDASRMKAP